MAATSTAVLMLLILIVGVATALHLITLYYRVGALTKMYKQLMETWKDMNCYVASLRELSKVQKEHSDELQKRMELLTKMVIEMKHCQHAADAT
jgi:hypothetical protein